MSVNMDDKPQCVYCGFRITGTMIGAGDGTGQNFAHPDCYYRKECERKDATIARLEKDYGICREEYSAAKYEKDILLSRVDTLRASLAAAEKEVTAHTDVGESLMKEVKRLDKELAAAEADIKCFKAGHEEAVAMLIKAEAREKGLREKVQRWFDDNLYSVKHWIEVSEEAKEELRQLLGGTE